MKRFSLQHLVAYVTAWAIWLAVHIAIDTAPDLPKGIAAVVVFTMLTSFSMLTGGVIGFLLGGRQWFWPATCAAFVIVLALLIYPAINAAR